MSQVDPARVSADLLEAARLLRNLPDQDADKAALQRRLVAITSSAKHDLTRARNRLSRLLEELRSRT